MIRAIVVMGVTGSGKSTLGAALARALGWQFLEGDSLHPAANIKKMAAGIALDDADRRPFLASIATALAESRPHGMVVSCSALKRSYREQLRSGDPDACFVLPLLTHEQLLERLQRRAGHFMPAALLDSQLATFEPLAADECAIRIPGDETLNAQVRRTLLGLQALGTAGPSGNA
ncbi:MAG TPA: gluconokinase [Steroidobacteraceae bacterium]|nr:gluconokinase [Steroidobacteraceae bacterium]